MLSHTYSLTDYFILTDRLKEEGIRRVIKAQTAVTGCKKGGREEGREEERFLERRGKQDMQKEKEKGETQGWLVPNRGSVLTGAPYIPGSNRGGQNTCSSLPDGQDAGKECRF